MSRTPLVITAIAVSLYCSYAFSQAAAPPAGKPAQGQPAQTSAATSDEELTKAIYSALKADPDHYFRHVTVSVDKGVATLGGFVYSSDAIYRARTLAGRVPGVSHVDADNLHLQPNRPR